MEEAILHGVLEVIERDAFLLTWYVRMPVPVIDPSSATDPTIPLLVEQIHHEQGYLVSLFDTTLDHGVPSVWAMAVRADDDETRPQVCCSAGAHLLPERAISGALAELGPILDGLIDAFPGTAERLPAMVADAGNVTQMADNGLLYGDSRVFDRLDFLTAPRACVSIGVSFGAERAPIAGDDLTEDLHALTGRLLAEGLDVIAVDQTTQEHCRAGLSCVKVLVPRHAPDDVRPCLPSAARLAPAARLGPAARGAGPARLRRSLTDAELNPHPHPFP